MPISVYSSSYSTRSAVRASPSGAPGIWPVAVSEVHMTSTDSMSRMTLRARACSSRVHRHVDHAAVGVAHEEAADAPRLVGQRVHDLEAAGDGLGVQRVDVLHLDRDLRLADPAVQTGLRAIGDGDLGGAVARARAHRETRLVHRDGEAQEALVEVARRCQVVGDQVRDRAPDRHRRRRIAPRRLTPPTTPTQPWQFTQPKQATHAVQPTLPRPETTPALPMTPALEATPALPMTAALAATPAEPPPPPRAPREPAPPAPPAPPPPPAAPRRDRAGRRADDPARSRHSGG